MHYAGTAHKLREQIVKFSGVLSAGLPKTARRFVLTFLDNRIFQARIEGIADWKTGDAFPQRIVGLPPGRLVTAHQDGTLRVWDFLEKGFLIAGTISMHAIFKKGVFLRLCLRRSL